MSMEINVVKSECNPGFSSDCLIKYAFTAQYASFSVCKLVSVVWRSCGDVNIVTTVLLFKVNSGINVQISRETD